MVLSKYFIPEQRLLAMYNEKNELILFYGDTLGIPPRRAKPQPVKESPKISEVDQCKDDEDESSASSTTVLIEDVDKAEDTIKFPQRADCCRLSSVPRPSVCQRFSNLPQISKFFKLKNLPRVNNCFKLENLPRMNKCFKLPSLPSFNNIFRFPDLPQINNSLQRCSSMKVCCNLQTALVLTLLIVCFLLYILTEF